MFHTRILLLLLRYRRSITQVTKLMHPGSREYKNCSQHICSTKLAFCITTWTINISQIYFLRDDNLFHNEKVYVFTCDKMGDHFSSIMNCRVHKYINWIWLGDYPANMLFVFIWRKHLVHFYACYRISVYLWVQEGQQFVALRNCLSVSALRNQVLLTGCLQRYICDKQCFHCQYKLIQQ